MFFNRNVTIQNRIFLLWNIMCLGTYMEYNPRKIVGDKNRVSRISFIFAKTKENSCFMHLWKKSWNLTNLMLVGTVKQRKENRIKDFFGDI